MTWTDNNGDVRPQSWEEYCEMKEQRLDVLKGLLHSAYRRVSPLPRTVFRADGKISKIRRRLFRADPHCFWCGRSVFLDVPHATPALATVDHLYSRLHPQRAEYYRRQNGVLHVLACHECNHYRSVCEQRNRPFVPKLPERLEFAQLADATLADRNSPTAPPPLVIASKSQPVHVRTLKEEFLDEARPVLSMRVICTLEEAIAYAKENPGR